MSIVKIKRIPYHNEDEVNKNIEITITDDDLLQVNINDNKITDSDIIEPLGKCYILPKKAGLTESGYQRIDFNDYYDKPCLIQQSSLAQFTMPGSSCLWLGRKGEDMHLSLNQVKSLIKHLQLWVDTGKLELPENIDK